MKYQQVSEYLFILGKNAGIPVHRVQQPKGARATALNILPVASFVAMECAGQLCMGIYEQGTRRLVGTHQLDFSDLTPQLLHHLVDCVLPTSSTQNHAKQEFATNQ